MSVTPIVDKPLLRHRIDHALTRGVSGTDFLMAHAVSDVAARLAVVERTFDTCVALHGVTADLARQLQATGKVDQVIRLEPTHVAGLTDNSWPTMVGEEEFLPLAPASVDLIVAPLSLHWSNDLPGTFLQIAHSLKPDGLFLGSMLGGETLQELRFAAAAADSHESGGASPRILPFADLRDLGGLLQRAGFALPVVDRDCLTVRYDHALALAADLKAMGASNCLSQRSRKPVTRGFLSELARVYQDNFSDPDARIRATFDVISLSGWCPHESQQKPAQRGSGTVSLTEVLGKT